MNEPLTLPGDTPIFVGFKLSNSLKRELDNISGPDRKYVSYEDSTYLRICRVDQDHYVGKLIHDRLTTPRVEDVRRNVLSIMRRLCPEERLPNEMSIICGPSAVLEDERASPFGS